MMMNFIVVGIGGALGSISRYALNIGLTSKYFNFPLATFLANILSCLILGATVSLFSKGLIDEKQRLLIITGFCGGFSTFSTFTNETYQLFQTGNYTTAIANVFFNVLICMIFLILGFRLA